MVDIHGGGGNSSKKFIEEKLYKISTSNLQGVSLTETGIQNLESILPQAEFQEFREDIYALMNRVQELRDKYSQIKDAEFSIKTSKP